jgi:hypothetical protein
LNAKYKEHQKVFSAMVHEDDGGRNDQILFSNYHRLSFVVRILFERFQLILILQLFLKFVFSGVMLTSVSISKTSSLKSRRDISIPNLTTAVFEASWRG